MVLKVTHKELSSIVYEYYKKKLALFVWGSFGLGKSQEILKNAEILAGKKEREFVDWNKLTKSGKEEVYKNPEKYFLVIDIRLAEYDSSDIKGLPNFSSDKESIDWKSPFFTKVLTKDGSDGILLFDEVNLATPLVMASCYKIIYDRIINDEMVNENWLIIGCGNLDSDKAFTHTLPAPLKDRGGEVELTVPSPDDWTDWATKQSIDNRIIAFINLKGSNLHSVDFEDNQKFVTPRGWERVSHLIKDVNDWDTFSLIVCSAIGEGKAREFVAFCKLKDKLDLDAIIKNPSKIEKIKGVDIKYLLVSAISERYSNGKIKFQKVIDISKVLDKCNDAEFVALLWRLCCSYTDNFKKDFLNSEEDAFIKRYGKYLI